MRSILNLLLFFPSRKASSALLLLTLAVTCGRAQSETDIVLLEEKLVAADGLYYAGERGTDYQFGPQLSAHGDCIKVSNGYLFVTWYQGGSDKRFLRLSRRRLNDSAAEWVHIDFPDQHNGYRGDPTKGDSHNTAAVGISTKDGRVHLLYDMHAYDRNNFPDKFFNYRISDAGAAYLPDAEFTIDKFSDRRDYLKEGLDYQRTTYPTFFEQSNGDLLVEYRIGGAGNGDFYLSRYNGSEWEAPYIFTDGTLPLPDRYSEYGLKKVVGDKFYACFSIRYSQDNRYALNSGIHFAQATAPFGPESWSDIDGTPITTPIQAPDHLRIAEPEEDYGTANPPRNSGGTNFVITENGSQHFFARVDNRQIHYWRGPRDSTLQSAAGEDIPGGRPFASGDYLIKIELSNGYPRIKQAPVGTNDWETVYFNDSGRRFHHFQAQVADGKLYAYLQERGEGQARPLYLQTYQLNGLNVATREEAALFLDLSLYPNPAGKLLQIENAPGAGTYRVFDQAGRQVIQGQLPVDSIDVSRFHSGTYYFKLSTLEGSTVRKFMTVE